MKQSTDQDNRMTPRRRYRLRRLRLHPERSKLSDRETFLEEILEAALRKIREMNYVASSRAEEMREQVLRARADLDNYRKRAARDMEETRKFACQEFAGALVPALDSFEHALAALEENHDARKLAEGVEAVHRQMESVLAAQGLEKIEPLGQFFDPNRHEALAVVKTAEHPENTIIDVLQSGYVLNGRLLRPARVRIARKA